MRQELWLLAAATLLTACGSAHPATGGRSSAPPTPPPTSVSPSPTETQRTSPPWPVRKSPLCAGRDWAASICHRLRPPTETGASLTKVRISHHAGYDRATFDFDDTVPGFEVAYVREVIRSPSDEKVRMPGSAYLELNFSFAWSGKDEHLETKLRPKPHKPVPTGLSTLRAYIMNQDHHGAMTFALGLSGRTDFRVTVKGRSVLVDVRHP